MAVVVISSDGKGDRPVGSLEVKAPDGREDRSDPYRGASNLTGRSVREPGSLERRAPRETDCGIVGSAEPLRSRRRPVSTSQDWTHAMFELPGVIEDGMSGRNGQRKLGTARGSPRRSRTAKASRISRATVKSRCAREWGGWGREVTTVRDNITRTRARVPGAEDYPPSMAVHDRVVGPTQSGISEQTTKCTKGGRKLPVVQRMPGAGLSWRRSGKAPSEMPAFQPYRGKPDVRNDRGGRGNVGIIRSPVRASTLPDWFQPHADLGCPSCSIHFGSHTLLV